MRIFVTNYPRREFPRCGTGAFTIIEMLVAMAVLSLILVLTVEIISNTGTAIRSADGQRGSSSAARVAMDRLSADFSTAMLTGGATAIVSTPPAASEIRFVCLSRARDVGSLVVPRGAVVAYSLRDVTESVGGSNLTYQTLMRGDGRMVFTAGTSTLATVFQNLSQTVPPLAFMTWEPVGSGLVQFHISYVLDDGTVTQTPPSYSMVSPQNGTRVGFLNNLPLGAGFLAVAFAPENSPVSSPHSGRYVKSLIITVAAVDPDVLARATSAQLTAAKTTLGTPTGTETALAKWQGELKNIGFQPIKESIRFYQRTLSVP